MSGPIHALRPVTHSEQCEGCRTKDHEIAELRAQIERLTRAVQRDSEQYERRAVHDGKTHVRLRR